MEKELLIESDSLCLNFFYEDFELSQAEIAEYKTYLTWMMTAVSEFVSSELKVSDRLNLNVSLVNDEHIKDLNKDHRGKDKITDVLSFPMQESIRDDDYDSFNNEMELGDLFVCHSVCQNQADEFEISYIEEFVHLCVHGILHLCGFDHEISEDEEKIMEDFEVSLVKRISDLKNN